MSLGRALELAESALGQAYPNPTVGAVVVANGQVAGEGVTEAYGGRHGEVVALGRPFVTYKAAVTLDGSTTLPGERWITGEESRRLVHELRAASDAVAVGGGTARIDRPELTARAVETPRGQPRRLVFGAALPEGLDLELRNGPIEQELRALAAEGVQSLLLEGGPTLAASFLAAGLVDRLLVFVAPRLAGDGSGLAAALPEPLRLVRLEARPVGEDVLLSAYLREP